MSLISRRNFLAAAIVSATAATASGSLAVYPKKVKENKLPRWRGFNILEFYRPRQYHTTPERRAALERDFQWMADWGFDFVRIPMSYPCYLTYDAKLGIPITPEETVMFREEAVDAIEETIQLANKYG